MLAGCARTEQAPAVHYGLTGGADSAGMHTVMAGDTLYDIATRYDLPLQDIIFANNLAAPYRLEIGQRLKMPPPTTYRVRAGDTLYGISRTFSISQTELAKLNHLHTPFTITEGDMLRLPSYHRETQLAQNTRVRSTTNAGAGTPSPGFKPPYTKATERTKQRISAATPKRAASKFSWPVPGRVISRYGPKQGGLHNDGINIAAPRGTPVQAADNGVVVYAGNELKGFGNLVLVRHSDGWVTAYAHLDRMTVSRGETISLGHKIGTVGSTGNVSRPQLHFEIRKGTKALNPELYLSRGV